MGLIIEKLRNLSERQVLTCLGVAGATLFLAVLLLTPPTVVNVWEKVDNETGTVVTIGSAAGRYSAASAFAIIELDNGKAITVPVSTMSNFRAGDKVSLSVEVNTAKKAKPRYKLIEKIIDK